MPIKDFRSQKFSERAKIENLTPLSRDRKYLSEVDYNAKLKS
jgi:hypothetical protein